MSTSPIQLSPQSLLRADETFVIHHSDFNELNEYLSAVKTSSLDDHLSQISETLRRYHASGPPVDEFLSCMDTAVRQYHNLINVCDDLLKTAPSIPDLCQEIKLHAAQAPTKYGQLFDYLVSLTEKHEGRSKPLLLARVTSHHLANHVAVLRAQSRAVAGALAQFESDARPRELNLEISLGRIMERVDMLTALLRVFDEIGFKREVADISSKMSAFQDELSKLNDKWQHAVGKLELLEGAWGAIGDDLGNIMRALERPELFTEQKVVLKVDRAGIVKKWSSIDAEVDRLIDAEDGNRIYGYTSPR